ncbi:methyl-accepting chemotaxis protein [Angelakisella massiliensis]|uniref:methyl-accepting chemotaxis protein n=1 Tax=Angelakisella massiliensis TaxID=1871018 RepID=UPI0008F95882|nr:HAMP domain-containing methyl-accepting chemotaxis protein [Angelakisella massiliensis]
MFHKMKLKPYLLTVFSVLIVLAGIITAVGCFGLVNTSNNTDELVNKTLAADSAVKTCRIEANIAARDLREMALTENADDAAKLKANINESMEEIQAQIEVFKKAHGTEDGLAQKYETAFNNWFSIATQVMDQLDSGNRELATQTILTQCSPAMSQLASIANEINAVTEQERVNQENHTMAMLRIFMAVLGVVFVVALIFGLLVAFKTTRMITGAVSKIQKAASELSQGDLKTTVDYEGANEFGELADRLNFSFQELSKYVDAIDYGMSEFSKGNFGCHCPVQFIGDFASIQKSIENFQDRMRDILSELETASSQVSAGADQVADGAQALAQGATEQASSIEELSASISDISSRISDTAEFSRKADQLGQNAREIVNKGKNEMGQLLVSIQDIATASNNIQSIIKVIDDIAFQTNILALNAAVEAARAGNAGKGFAVVADEVRSLAQKSANAAQETTDLIKNSLQHVSQGEEIAERTDAAFNEVANAAQDMLDMIEKIAHASEEQASSISQISVGIDQISSVVQTNSATSEESAAASEELSGQAGVMKNLLAQFNISSSACADYTPVAVASDEKELQMIRSGDKY